MLILDTLVTNILYNSISNFTSMKLQYQIKCLRTLLIF